VIKHHHDWRLALASEVVQLDIRIIERLGAAFHSLDVILTSPGTGGSADGFHVPMVLIPTPVADDDAGIFNQNASAIALSEGVLLPLVATTVLFLLPFTEGTALLLRLIWSLGPTHFSLISTAFLESLVKLVTFDVFSSNELVAQTLHILRAVLVVLLDIAGLAAFNLREVTIISSRSN